MRRRKLMNWNRTYSAPFATLFPTSYTTGSSSSSFSFLFVSSFSAAAAIVVAFDVAVLSNALESFATKQGGKHSFDLFVCLPSSLAAMELAVQGKLEDVLVSNGIAEYRAVLHANCSEIQPQLPKDYSQILYLIIPDNKAVVGDTLAQISQFYRMIKRTFYSASPVGKLLWLPLFIVVWPDLADYCGNDRATEKLIRASFHQPSPPPPRNNNNSSVDGNNSRNNNKAVHKALVAADGDKDDSVFPLSSSQQSFSVNSDVYFYFGRECEGKRDNVWEVYTLHPTADIIVQKLTPDGRPYESMYEGILGRVRRRRNLRNTTIRAVAAKDPSSFLRGPPPGAFNPLDIINGTARVVFQEMRQGLNFSVDIIIGDWIRKKPNGTLKGTTAALFRKGLADVTISMTSLLPYRKVELSFLQPTYSDGVNGFFVQPAASSFRDIVIAPFSFGLWISLLITYLIIVASIFCFGKVYRKMYAVEAAVDSRNRLGLFCQQGNLLPENDSTFEDELVMWAVGAITQQGWHICPHSNSTRMVFLLGYFLGLVCYGAFSAAVVSILAVELIPIKTRSDLLTSSLTFYADNASSTMAYIVSYLRNNTDVSFGSPVDLQGGVEKLQNSKQDPSCYLAFPQYFYLSAAAINISQSWICEKLSVVPVTTTDTPSSMVVPRNSEYAELFNFMILKMIGRGLNYRFRQLYREVTTLKCSSDNSGKVFHPLAYSDMFTAFMIVFLGTITASTLLLLERVLIFLRKQWTNLQTFLKQQLSTPMTHEANVTREVTMYGNWLR